MSKSRSVELVTFSLVATALSACGRAPGHNSTRVLELLQESHGAAAPAAYPQRPTTYVLDGPLADLGPSARVRQLMGHGVTADDLARISGALEMHGTPVRTENGWRLSDGEALLTVGVSGGATSVDYMSNWGTGSSPGSVGGALAGGAGSTSTASGNTSSGVATPPNVSPPVPSSTSQPQTAPSTTLPTPVGVPSADDAVSIAHTLLDGFGVLSGQQWSYEVSDVKGVAVSCSPGVQCVSATSPVTARTVDYSPVVDGVRVPSVSWSVTIGEHRLVASVSGTWARPQIVGTYALRPTRSVFDDLQGGDARFVGPQPLGATARPGSTATAADDNTTTTTVATNPLPRIEVHVTGVSLGMALWDGLDNGQNVAYLVPSYRFVAHVTGGSTYEIELLALDPADFALVAPPTTSGPLTSEPRGSVVPQTAPAPTPAGISPPGR